MADSIPDNPLGLLSVGDEYFAGDSPRGRLDKLGSALWAREANKVRHSGEAVDHLVRWENGVIRIVVEPIRAPTTQAIVGVTGVITNPGSPLPARPVFGVVEWKVDQATGNVLLQGWDAGMRHLYEGSVPEGNLAQWINETIARPGKEAFEGAIRNSFGDRDSRYLIKYFVHPARDRSREKHLEISGWTSDDSDDHNIFWLRGIVREAKEGTPVLRPVKGFFMDDLFQKAVALADDRLFLRIDTKTWDYYCPPDIWESHGLSHFVSASLGAVLDCLDLRSLQDSTASGDSGSLQVKLPATAGWTTYDMKWTRLSGEGPGAQFILGYLRPQG